MKKPNRPGYRWKGRIPIATYDAAVALAAKTTLNNAERVYGLSAGAISAEMARRGIARRRRGNLTLAELDNMRGLFVL